MAAAAAAAAHVPSAAEQSLRDRFLTAGSVSAIVDVGEKIGAGGFSVVRLGTLRASGERVAVKVILPTHYASATQRQAALHEVMVLHKLGALQSPHILRLLSAHEDRSPATGQLRLSLCTELVQGGELFDEIMALGQYSEQSASRLICRLAETLKAVHGAGVIHRDLKPENVLLRSKTADAMPVLADFGLALVTGESDTARDVVGTNAYLAPEIILHKEYSRASDVWAVGVLIYILLGGYQPFNDDPTNPKALFRAITDCDYEFHEDAWGSVSPEAKDLVSRLLVADPRQRITLDGLLEHPWIVRHAEMPSAHLTGTVGRMRTFNARRKVRAAVQAVIFGKRHLQLMRDALGLKSDEFGDVALTRLHKAFNRHATAAASKEASSVGATAAVACTMRTVGLEGFRSICSEVGLGGSLLADRLFAAFDLDSSGDIDWRELLAGATALKRDDDNSAVAYCFSVFDTSSGGSISRDELIQLLICTGYNPGGAAAAAEDARDEAGAHARLLLRLNALFERIDLNHDNRLSLEEFQAAFRSDKEAREAILSPLQRFGSKSSGLTNRSEGKDSAEEAVEGKSGESKSN